MRRPLLSIGLVALVACFTAGALLAAAPERATFILSNGERVSGAVVFHTDARNNFRADRREFNLGTTDGKEVAIPIDQIAVIDFVAGTPAQAELDALKNDTHMLAMRDGSTRTGLLLDFIGGDTVQWRTDTGGEEIVPIRTVKRIYMSTPSARSIFDYKPAATAPGGTTTATATGRVETPPIPDGPGIVVMANVRWTDTGLTVQIGERVRFAASGKIAYPVSAGQIAPPEGDVNVKDPTLPVPSLPLGALIGRIGNGVPFAIGNSTDAIVMAGRGRLQLSVNDNGLTDNTGGFRVVVTRSGRS